MGHAGGLRVQAFRLLRASHGSLPSHANALASTHDEDCTPMATPTQYLLDASRMPKHWYNIAADLPSPPPAVLHPGTHAADRARPTWHRCSRWN